MRNNKKTILSWFSIILSWAYIVFLLHAAYTYYTLTYETKVCGGSGTKPIEAEFYEDILINSFYGLLGISIIVLLIQGIRYLWKPRKNGD